MTPPARPTPGLGEPLQGSVGLDAPSPTCQVYQALEAGGEVTLRALGVAEVQGLQGRHGWELPADQGEAQGRERVRVGQEPQPQPCQTGRQPGKLGSGAVPELCMQEGVIVEDEGLQVDQAPHLWWEALQLVVAQVQVQQVRQVDEELVGDAVDAVGIWGNSGLPRICSSPGSPSRRGREQDPEQSGTNRGGHGQEGEVVTLAGTHLLWPRLRTSMFLAFSSSLGHSVSWL